MVVPGCVGEQSLEHGLPDETGGSGQEDVRVAEIGRRSLASRCHGMSLAETVERHGRESGKRARRSSSMRRRLGAPVLGRRTRCVSKKVRSSSERSTAPIGQTACFSSRRVSLRARGERGEAALRLFGEEARCGGP